MSKTVRVSPKTMARLKALGGKPNAVLTRAFNALTRYSVRCCTEDGTDLNNMPVPTDKVPGYVSYMMQEHPECKTFVFVITRQ